MAIMLLRSIIIYICVLIVIRLMGKRQVGEMQPFEFVVTLIIADLACIPMAELSVPIVHGIVPILSLLFMHIIISVLNIKSNRFREFICGKPRILIKNGRIDERALIKENFTINELQEQLRVNNINNLSDVEYAILETSGQISVIPKSDKRPTTPEDFGMTPEKTKIPYDLVVDGRIMGDNLQKINKDKTWLINELKKHELTPEETDSFSEFVLP